MCPRGPNYLVMPTSYISPDTHCVKLARKGEVNSPEVGKAGTLFKIRNKLLRSLSDITDVKKNGYFIILSGRTSL